MIASHRQNRPQMPKDWCPFCPGSGKVPEHYDVYKYDNDFPALSENPPEPDDVANDFFQVKPAYGKCEVILYSPGHTVTLPELSVEHIGKLVELWAERFTAISSDENIKYVFIFENRGELVGVTMPHPHGQIYGYSYVPKKSSWKPLLPRNTRRKREIACSAICLPRRKKPNSASFSAISILPFFCRFSPNIPTAFTL